MIPYLGCQGARDMLEPFVDGELPVSEQVALEAHLRWCDICRARVEDIRLIGSALRLGSDAAAADYTDAAARATMYDEVVMRVEAERTQSLAHQWRELFTDMRYLWPAFGATAAVIVCVCASTLVNQIVRAERPDSMAAQISDPGESRLGREPAASGVGNACAASTRRESGAGGDSGRRGGLCRRRRSDA